MAMQKTGRLELTWVGKYDEKVIEPRLLLEDREKSYGDPSNEKDRKSTRLNSSHIEESRMPSSA